MATSVARMACTRARRNRAQRAPCVPWRDAAQQSPRGFPDAVPPRLLSRARLWNRRGHGVRVGLIRSGRSRRRIGKCNDQRHYSKYNQDSRFHEPLLLIRFMARTAVSSSIHHRHFCRDERPPEPGRRAKKAGPAHASHHTTSFIGHRFKHEQENFLTSLQSENTPLGSRAVPSLGARISLRR